MRAPTVPLVSSLFVFIWATGFVTARFVAPYAEPLGFVALRVVATVVVLLALVAWRGARWPGNARQWRDTMAAGTLMQGLYLAGTFWSVKHGLPAGIAALVGSLQPLMTAALAGPFLGERVSPRRWIGIGAGFLGAALVLAPKVGAGGGSGIPPLALAVSLGGTGAMTIGTLWQKRAQGGVDLLANVTLQFAAAALLLVPLALLASDWHFEPGPALYAGFAWSVFGNSVAGILLLMLLIRRGEVAGVASLLFLVPPVSAAMAYALFGETLTLVQLAGMAVAAAGVALASRG